ncbi:MAG: hypothetical protein IJ887_06015 [Prevotella sp.]|nr:hypothetical protein [Prevotella sp.]
MTYEKTTEIIIVVLESVAQILKAIKKLCGLKGKSKNRDDFKITDY